ncbi:MAG: class I SAM-dependent methyltransferase [Frankiales bacterium]|nr:MAG: class I SAM-dependent methyltransferase [Frankiales bacterium]
MTRPRTAAPGRTETSPAELLTRWLAGDPGEDLQPRLLRLADGRLLSLPVARWAGPVTEGDRSLLARAHGPVLDVGCGPGRLTAELHARGVDVLGVEVLPQVPVLAREAGAPLHVADVFADLPRAGEWRTVLLADGNTGIGGAPVRLLRRVHDLLAPGGSVLCELLPYAGTAGPVRLEGLGATSAWFPWSVLDAPSLRAAARAADLTPAHSWECDGRAFTELVRS